MENAYKGSTFVPVEGYEWIEAIAPKKPKLGEPAYVEDKRKPQPCLVAKEEYVGGEAILCQRVELLDPSKKSQKLAYEEFYNLHKYFYEKEKLMEAILKFANRYGSIVEFEAFLTPTLSKEGKSAPVPVGVPLEYWEDEIYNFWNYFTLYNAIYPELNIRLLKEHILWAKTGVWYWYMVGKRVDLEEGKPQKYKNDPKGAFVKMGTSSHYRGGQELIAQDRKVKHLGFVRGDVVKPAKYLLTQKINTYLEKTTGLRLNSEREMLVTFNGTLSLIWFQLAQLVAGKRKIINCPYCGLFLDVTGTRLTAHPECRNSHKKESYYQRLNEVKKLYKQGLSFEEIASRFDSKKFPKFSDPEWLRKTLNKSWG
ncbi:MAG: hypothetical protein PWP04_1728 [Candidatus Atribacteria bacterium]|nr:hypothetical protein [Candidatus Atribacteria bacterium]